MRQLRPALIRRGWLWASAAGMAALLLAGTGEAQQRAGGAPAALPPVGPDHQDARRVAPEVTPEDQGIGEHGGSSVHRRALTLRSRP